jgi:hypothetical protein
MNYYEAKPIIEKAIENLAKMKGVNLERDLTIDQWLQLPLNMLKHIDEAKRSKHK